MHHNNNFNFLRLLFATLVIVAHAPAIIDGTESRELLHSIIGTRTFGEVAVDGFFLVSGYLIVMSFERSTSPWSYLRKRIRRIYPGYLAACAICFLLAPFTGDSLNSVSVFAGLRAAALTLFLQGVTIKGFVGMPIETMNGSLWTISYEFRCYLLVLAVGFVFGTRRYIYLAGTAVLLILSAIEPHITFSDRIAFFVGYPDQAIRLTSAFGVGACFYLFRANVSLVAPLAALATMALGVLMFLQIAEAPAFALFGGYIIFWFALALKVPMLQQINGKQDISYGVYLYAWPISASLVYFAKINSPWALILLSIPLSYIAGFISWQMVERPFVHRRKLADNPS